MDSANDANDVVSTQESIYVENLAIVKFKMGQGNGLAFLTKALQHYQNLVSFLSIFIQFRK